MIHLNQALKPTASVAMADCLQHFANLTSTIQEAGNTLQNRNELAFLVRVLGHTRAQLTKRNRESYVVFTDINRAELLKQLCLQTLSFAALAQSLDLDIQGALTEIQILADSTSTLYRQPNQSPEQLDYSKYV